MDIPVVLSDTVPDTVAKCAPWLESGTTSIAVTSGPTVSDVPAVEK
jgi:hypothetical protein